MRVSAAPPPVITAQPGDTNVVYGGTGSFSVTASSSSTLSYQWYRDGLLILDELLTGETRSTLVMVNPSSSDEGRYFVKVSNAGGTVISSKAQLTLVPNTPPVAAGDVFSTLEDVPLIIPAGGVLTNDYDINGQVLVPVVVANVASGTLSVSTNGALAYYPVTNFNGVVSFTYQVSDGYSVLAEQNTTSGDATEIRSTKSGSQSFRHGSVGGASYWVNKLTFYVSRKSSLSGNLNVSVGTGLNSGPVGGSAVAIPTSSITNTSEGASFQTYTIVYAAPVGPLSAGTTYYLNFESPGSARFFLNHSPNAYGNGTYYENAVDQAEDLRFSLYETVMSNPATVTINVAPVNDAPVAVADWLAVLEDTPTTLNVVTNDFDPEGAGLSLTGVTTTNGTAVVSGTNILFTPALNYNGWVLLNYTVSDGSLSSTGYVAAYVYPVNDAPLPANDTYTTAEDVPLTIAAPGVTINDFDVEGDSQFVFVWNNVTHGTLTLNTNGGFTYVPFTNYYGTDSFTYVEHDGQAWATNLATVTIVISPVNDAPVAVADSTNVVEDTTLAIRVLANDYDPEGTLLTLTGAVTTNGTAQVSGGNVIFRPATNYTGLVVLNYTVSDGTNSTVGTVSVNVTPVNDAPVAANDAYTIAEDTTLTVPVSGLLSTGNAGTGVLANDTDVDGDTLTATLVTTTSHGQLTFRPNGSFTYTPDADFNGTDSFTYRAVDGTATGNVATVTITVTPVPDTPTVVSQRMTSSGYELVVTGFDSSTCVIWASSDLQKWTAVSTNAVKEGAVTYTDAASLNLSQRFYRVEAR